MALHVTMTADALGRSRFATSAAHEVVDAVRLRDRHPAPHARCWYQRAREGMPGRLREVLEALVPDDHVYAPDFLSPPPRADDSVDTLLDRIASTPPEVVDHHLDIALRGRRVRPEVVALFGSPAGYEAWRRPVPGVLADLVSRGPSVVAAVAAAAVGAFFDTAVREDWRGVREVLVADIRRRSDQMARIGAIAMLDALGDGVSWDGASLAFERPYEGVVDWADDGLLLVPTTSHVGPVQISAERPSTPMVFYRADGIATLWSRSAPVPAKAVSDLLGATRARLLAALSEPRATADLSRLLRVSEATVSYHLQILLAAGLLTRHRRGRRVLYEQTPAASVLAGGPPVEPVDPTT